MKFDSKERLLVAPHRLALLLGLLLALVLAACAPPPAVQTRAAESVAPVRDADLETEPETETEAEPTGASETAMLPIVSGGAADPATPEPAPASAPAGAVDISLPEDAVRVQFDLGEVEKVLTGTLEEGEVDTFVLRANGGEPLLIDLVSADESLQLSLYGRGDGIPLIHEISNVRRWSGRLPQAQEYVLHVTADGITVTPANGAEDETGDAAKTRVGKVAAQAGAPYEIHISQPQRVGFAPGQTTAVVRGNLAVGQIAPYVVNVAQGQWLQVTVNSPRQTAVLSVQGLTDGFPYQDGLSSGNTFWFGQANMTQDYLLRVFPSSGATEFTMTISVTNTPPSGQPAPPAAPPSSGAPAFINIAPGNTATNLPGQIATNGTATYALRGVAGQSVAINVTSPTNSVFLTIYGASDGVPLALAANGVQSWLGVLPSTQDYIITAVNIGLATNYTLSLIIPERITFAANSVGTVRSGLLGPTGFIHYIFRANSGQEVDLNLQSDTNQIVFKLVGATDGVVLADGVQSWRGRLPHTQDYAVRVVNVGRNPSNYTLTTTVR